ncbi:MAG: sensor histidine kinase [Butyrivibrio sp.]|nr:sensor histidine kinase [Butyrivibrio sp.]
MGIIRQSFKRQIFVVFLAVTLLLVIFGGILTIQGFQARVKADYEKRDREQEAIIKERLENMLSLSESAIAEAGSNEVLLDIFAGKARNSLEVYSELYNITRDIREFAIFDIFMEGKCVYSTGSGNVTRTLPLSYAVLHDAAKNSGKNVYAFDPGDTTETGAALMIARNMTEGDPGNAVIVCIQQSTIKEQLSSGLNAKDGFMLTNKFLRPFCLLGTAEDGKELSLIRTNFFKNELYDTGFENNIYISELGDTNLLGIYITPPALDDSAVKAGYQILMLLVVVSIIICLVVSNRMSEYFSKPINTLAAAMSRFRKGDFDTKIELSREDEFEQLAVGFNKMTTQLKDTMEERVQAERKVNEARIEMMQAQLNPHFLYNTLDTIKWVAKANQVPEVATMSASLASILRTSISEKQFCPLSKELELVRNYCEIQQIRFDDSFDLTIDVDAELQNAIIPKLILQPIVENAIIHGMDETINGHIYVAAARDTKDGKDLLKISVQDDGKGISDEMLEALNNDDVELLKGHLGLNNVNTIIRLYYGKEYGVMAFRPTRGGTVMIVTLPYSEEEPMEEKQETEKDND